MLPRLQETTAATSPQTAVPILTIPNMLGWRRSSRGQFDHGAAQNAARLKACPKIRTRVQELQSTVADNVMAAEISDRNARVQAVNDRWNWLRAALPVAVYRLFPRVGTGRTTIRLHSEVQSSLRC